jgi:hypothetical protein
MDRSQRVNELDWKISQLSVAIDHYEGAIHSASQKEVKEYKQVVCDLNRQVKEMEVKRDLC